MPQKEQQYDISNSVEARAAFSEPRAYLQHALLCEESFYR